MDQLNGALNTLRQNLAGIAVAIAGLYVVMAGLTMIMTRGNPMARERVMSALEGVFWGLVIVGLGFALVAVIAPAVGLPA